MLLYVFGNNDPLVLIAFQDLPIEQYTDNYFNLRYALEELIGRRVDSLTENSLSNPYSIESAEETKQLLYAA